MTNTYSVGSVYDVLQSLQPRDDLPSGTPVVGECWDSPLNDTNGRHVRERHVHAALENARSGPVQEGAVGGGTGMICYDFKGGIGTASRLVRDGAAEYTLGAIVQSNHGSKELLRIDGVPVGAVLARQYAAQSQKEQNSILMVIATDAPFLPHQLQRLARRATHGLAKTGSISGNASGDLTLAFSTANKIPRRAFYEGGGYELKSIDQFNIHAFLEAASEAVEEAIINAIFMAEDMTGANDYFVPAIPLNDTLRIMRQHGRLPGARNE
jgi:L-aminopeptidase/D-esterase-like protein